MIKENKSPHHLPLTNVLWAHTVLLCPWAWSVQATHLFYAWYFSVMKLKSLYDRKHDRQKLFLIIEFLPLPFFFLVLKAYKEISFNFSSKCINHCIKWRIMYHKQSSSNFSTNLWTSAHHPMDTLILLIFLLFIKMTHEAWAVLNHEAWAGW